MNEEHAKTAGDILMISIAGLTITSWLPPLAALVSIIWGLLRIYESKTIQDMLKDERST